MRPWLFMSICLFLAVAVLEAARAEDEQPVEMKIEAPEFKEISDWINTKPIQLKDLRGKVVALHFWTFG